jgi:hypothetical protein
MREFVLSHESQLKEGDKIKVKIESKLSRHILKIEDNFGIDLSEYVTVRKDERDVMMAGHISLSTYVGRKIIVEQ